jgi:hypothetical protein
VGVEQFPQTVEAAGIRAAILEGKNFTTSAERPDFPHEYDRLPANTLHVNPGYQRALDVKRARRIAEAYNPTILDDLVVNVREEDCEPWLIRGQHRLWALQHLFGPEAMVPCRIYYGLTYEQEALIFVSEDTTRKVNRPAERWKAALDANWSPYVEINKLVDMAGWTASPNHGGRGHIRAIGALVATYEYSDGRFLYDALVTMREAGWAENPTPLPPALIGGMVRFLSRYRDQLPPPHKIAERMKRLPGMKRDKLMELATKRSDIDHITVDAAMLTTITTEWNSGLSTNRLHEPTAQDQRRWQIQVRDYPVRYPWHKS